jgi:hypothetical protein
MFLKRAAYALTGLVLSGVIALGAGLPLLPSSPVYSEPSQIQPTINSVITQLNGGAGYATATPIIGLGSYCTNSTGGTTPQICAGQRGAVLFTGLVAAGLAATGTTTTSVITNANVTASSICSATWNTAFTAGSGVTVATVVPTAGSLSVVSVNAGTTTNAVTTGTLGFNCVN